MLILACGKHPQPHLNPNNPHTNNTQSFISCRFLIALSSWTIVWTRLLHQHLFNHTQLIMKTTQVANYALRLNYGQVSSCSIHFESKYCSFLCANSWPSHCIHPNLQTIIMFDKSWVSLYSYFYSHIQSRIPLMHALNKRLDNVENSALCV